LTAEMFEDVFTAIRTHLDDRRSTFRAFDQARSNP
jgi:hypothetical protein